MKRPVVRIFSAVLLGANLMMLAQTALVLLLSYPPMKNVYAAMGMELPQLTLLLVEHYRWIAAGCVGLLGVMLAKEFLPAWVSLAVNICAVGPLWCVMALTVEGLLVPFAMLARHAGS